MVTPESDPSEVNDRDDETPPVSETAPQPEEIVEDEIEESDPYQLIPFVNMLSMETGALTHNHNVKYGDKRYKIIKIATAESSNFKFLEIDLNGNSRDNIITVEAEKLAAVNTWDIGSNYDISLTNISGSIYDINVSMSGGQDVSQSFSKNDGF